MRQKETKIKYLPDHNPGSAKGQRKRSFTVENDVFKDKAEFDKFLKFCDLSNPHLNKDWARYKITVDGDQAPEKNRRKKMVKTVELKKIAEDDNRKYTKDEGFEQLVRSIKEHGIIEPPVLRMGPDGNYRLLAGRRRIAAARKLKLSEVDCVIRYEDDSTDEEIALSENVNRLEMHPLDEAALFGRMAESGKSVEEIAKYYARSPSAIYKRLRLNSLIEELKGMFRDGGLNITGAAVLAELPEEDQKDFYNTSGKKFYNLYGGENIGEVDEEIKAVEINNIHNFIYKKQKNVIEESMKSFCEGCKKRTHNEDNALFEDVELFSDVCLDGDCYRAKQLALINTALTAAAVQMEEAGLKTDDKVFFVGGAPERIYKNATKARFEVDKEPVEFEVLRDTKYDRTGTTNRKKDVCWLIHTDGSGNINVERIGYKERPPKEKPSEVETGSGKNKSDAKKEIDKYGGRGVLEAVAKEMQKPSAAELVKELKIKGKIEYYSFEHKISALVFERLAAKRIEKETAEINYLELFLEYLDDNFGFGGEGSFIEKDFSDRQKKMLNKLFGNRSLKSVWSEFDDDARALIHFLLYSFLLTSELPNLDEVKDKKKNNFDLNFGLIWKYMGMSDEEYEALYLQAAKDVAAEALKPKGGKKKAEVVKKKTSAVENSADEDDDEQEPF